MNRMAKKAPTKIKEERLEDILFDCRNHLRGRAPMTDKRDLLLTLVFMKFIGERFDKQKEVIRNRYKDRDEGYIQFAINRPDEYGRDGVFFLKDEYYWNSLVKLNASDMAVAFDNAIKALSDIAVGKGEQTTYPLKNALPLQIFTKTALEPSVLKSVVDDINKISSEKFNEKDLIGRVYEYFLQAFSINADKEEGEFYTPHSIVELIASLIEPYDGTIYDPCCGSGGMFVQSAKFIEVHGGNKVNISVYGQEQEPSTYRLAKMNLAVRGISYHLGDHAGSTFTDEQHKDVKMDYIMANPPFNLKKWRTEEQLTDDPRWKGYGVPPVSNANYAWILHMLHKLDENHGVAGFLLANGALDDQDTLAIRQKLIENDKVEAIIVLPRNMFYSTDISVTLWILNNNKKGGMWHKKMLRNRSKEILFVDLRTWSENIYEKKYVQFSEEQIAEICNIYFNWQLADNGSGIGSPEVCQKVMSERGYYSKPELYYAAKYDEIEEKGFSLVPSRYIEFVDRDTEIDYKEALASAGSKVKELLASQDSNRKSLIKAFKTIGYDAE